MKKLKTFLTQMNWISAFTKLFPARKKLEVISKALNNADIENFRFWFQVGAFAILVYGGWLAINIADDLPTFSCVYDEKRGGQCYLIGLQHQMATPWSAYLSGRGIGILVAFLTFFAWFILFNKAWCGYICPVGTIQDWINKLRVKLGIRYSEYSAPTFKGLNNIKYVLLALLILMPMSMGNSFFGLPKLSHEYAVPFCMICPGRTILPLFQGDFSQLAIDFSSQPKMILSALGMIVTGLFLIGAFFKKRFFCFFCPMSAFHYIMKKAGLLRLTKDGSKCTRCGNCYRACDVGIREIADDIVSKDIVKDDCMMCFKCVAVCPEEKCLKVSFLGVPLYEATEEGFYKRMEGKTDNDGQD